MLLGVAGIVAMAGMPGSAEARRTPKAEEIPERDRYVIRADREGTAKALIEGVGFFRPLDGGVIFDSIAIEKNHVDYRLGRVGAPSTEAAALGVLSLWPAGLAAPGERTSRSFVLRTRLGAGVDEPAVRAALEAAARSVVERDAGDFFTYLGRPQRIGWPEVLGLRPFHPHVLFLVGALAALALAWVRARPPRLSLELKTTHVLPSVLQSILLCYWALYWPGLRQHAPLLPVQIAYAFVFDAAFCLGRYRQWRAGLGPLPITLSTNLFMQFPVENLHLSLLALSAALASRHLLRRADGTHLFNPSAFGIACVGALNLALPALGDGDVSMELALPPNTTELILLLALVVQLRLRITLIALSAALSLLLFARVTGFTYFQPFWPPVFLVLTLVAGDPATSPRTGPGRLLYGAALGLLMGSAAALLEENGLSDFYGKILPVVLVNLAVPLFDRLGARLGASLGAIAAPRWNLVHVALWIALVAGSLTRKPLVPELHAFYQTPLTRPAADGTVSCESSPLFCQPFSFREELRAWRELLRPPQQ